MWTNLLRSQQKGARLTIEGAAPDNDTGQIDAFRALKNPYALSRRRNFGV